MDSAVHRFAIDRLTHRPQRLTSLAVAVTVLAAAGIFGWQHFLGASRSVSSPAPSITGVARIDGGQIVPIGVASPRSESHPIHRVIIVAGTTDAGSAFARVLRTDGQGRFHVNAPPGRYTVTAIDWGGRRLPVSRQPHQTITVKPGHPIHIVITGVVL